MRRQPRRSTGPCRASMAAAALALLLTACPDTDEPAADAPDAEEPPPADEDAPADEAAPTDAPAAAGSLEDVPELVREVAPTVVAVEVVLGDVGQPAQGAGSGTVWSADGIVVTNAHVVAEADEITVVLADGTRHDAEVLALDPRTDLAVIEIDADDLAAAEFAPSLPDLGELVVAIGNPLGFQNTVTVGIVSGLDRSLPAGPEGPVLAGLIQTDAAISSGSSGGALVDGAGRVVGVNVAAAALPEGMGVVEGIGFAIPATTVVPVVEELVETGEVAHAYLGIGGATVTPQLAERFDLERTSGVLVGAVEAGSPADDAGLVPRDVIVAIDGSELEELGDLLLALRQHAPGDTVSVTLVRNGAEEMVEATLTEPPDDL